MSGKRLRYEILRYIRDWERSQSGLPDLEGMTEHLGQPHADVSDQLDILDDLGAIRANRTLGGGASPMLKGRGKMLLEELEVEFGDEVKASTLSQISGKYEWDVFICHASEDKEPFVEELANTLQKKYSVWYDRFSLRVGDSLRRKIDEGLAKSRFGVVVLSPNFFAKDWPQNELDGLTAREVGGRKVILPVWLDIDYDGVKMYSPMLAGRYAAKASQGMTQVFDELVDAIEEPQATHAIPNGKRPPTVSGNSTRAQIVEDPGPDRPRFEVQGGGGGGREDDFQPNFKLSQFSGDPVADLQWRIRGPRFYGMDWRHVTGGQLNRTHFVYAFDLSQPATHDDHVGDNEMGFEVRFRWRGAWRSEIHRWPITRRDLGHKVLWDIGRKILPPTLVDNSPEE